MNTQGKLHVWGNILGLIIICSALSFLFLDQFLHHDLPCPLCLLQRTCYIAIGLTMLMNLYRGFKTTHYGLMLLATLLGLFISLHQISLHLAPGDTGYGMKILGQYLYTWAAISFAIILVLIATALMFEQGFKVTQNIHHVGLGLLAGIFLLLILANGVSTFILCGPYTCPSDPTHYYLLHHQAKT